MPTQHCFSCWLHTSVFLGALAVNCWLSIFAFFVLVRARPSCPRKAPEVLFAEGSVCFREMAAQTNVALAACRGEQHDALVSLRSSLGLMHLEREELQQDCKTLAILRAEQAAAMKICKQRCQRSSSPPVFPRPINSQSVAAHVSLTLSVGFKTQSVASMGLSVTSTTHQTGEGQCRSARCSLVFLTPRPRIQCLALFHVLLCLLASH